MLRDKGGSFKRSQRSLHWPVVDSLYISQDSTRGFSVPALLSPWGHLNLCMELGFYITSPLVTSPNWPVGGLAPVGRSGLPRTTLGATEEGGW